MDKIVATEATVNCIAPEVAPSPPAGAAVVAVVQVAQDAVAVMAATVP